jgi:hypothetical protein
MRRFSMIAPLLGLALAACESDADPGGDTGSVDGLLRAGGASLCGRIFECCPDGTLLFPQESDCEASYDDFGQFLDDAVSAGRLAYDPNAADSCLASFQRGVESSACDDLGAHLDLQGTVACGSTFSGQVAEGESCTLYRTGGVAVGADILCASGLTCVRQTCVHALAEGDACEAAADACAKPLACRDGHCARLAANGAACTRDADCESHRCSADQKCEAKQAEVTCVSGG